MPNTRPAITFKCRWVPNRKATRHFRASDAIRVCCSALEHGASLAEIEKGIKLCHVPAKERGETAAEALAVAEAALVANNELIASDTDVLTRMLQSLNILVAIARILRVAPVPQLRIVAVGAVALRDLVSGRLTSIAAQKAANDAALVTIRRAAANEAAFLQRVGL